MANQVSKVYRGISIDTLQGTNISPQNGILKMNFPFPKVGYVNSLEGKIFQFLLLWGGKKPTDWLPVKNKTCFFVIREVAPW